MGFPGNSIDDIAMEEVDDEEDDEEEDEDMDDGEEESEQDDAGEDDTEGNYFKCILFRLRCSHGHFSWHSCRGKRQ